MVTSTTTTTTTTTTTITIFMIYSREHMNTQIELTLEKPTLAKRTHYYRLNRLIQVIEENCHFCERLLNQLKCLKNTIIETESNKMTFIIENIFNYTNHHSNGIPIMYNILQHSTIVTPFIMSTKSSNILSPSSSLSSSPSSSSSSSSLSSSSSVSTNSVITSSSISKLIDHLLNIESHLPMKYNEQYAAAQKRLSMRIKLEVSKHNEFNWFND
ncbi:unnamed protein product [Schistosoma turkestanicum]|nr:unnamed protein product [Schistosoma turkestanicum]